MNKEALRKKINSLDALSKEEKAELTELLNTKRYGLVWEDKPEAVEEELKTQLPVLQEVAERKIIGSRLSAVGNQPVTETVKPQISLDFGTQTDTPQKDVEVQNIHSITQNINHSLIEGDNLHALTVLNYTHANKIDVIYIDPPYNTGNKDFKYNDTFKDDYIDRENPFRHSTWLSFMNRRLRLAKNLLSDKGVIFISIDDNEQAQLKLLCEEIFGEVNFVGVLVWEKKKKGSFLNNSITNIKEYIFIYVKNQVAFNGLTAQIISDEETYPCINPGNAISLRTIPKGVTSNFKEKDYILEKDNIISAGNMSIKLHSDLIIKDGLLSEDVILESEWRYSEDSLQTYAENGELYFTNQLYLRRIVKESRYKKLKDILPRIDYEKLIELQSTLLKLYKDSKKNYEEISKLELEIKSLEQNLTKINLDDLYFGGWGSNEDGDEELRVLLSKKVFDFPKPLKLLMKLFASLHNKNATILDFFAGSGTTLHAVMALNAEDGGSRQCILVTNNEVDAKTAKELEDQGILKGTEEFEKRGICQEVTYERNKRVIEGYTNAKGDFVKGLGGNNLRYYRTGYVPKASDENNKRLLTQSCTDLLCIKENCYDEITVASGFEAIKTRVFKTDANGDTPEKYMIVVYHSR